MNVSRMSTLVCLLSFLVSISHAQLTFDHTSAPGSMTILADLNDDGMPDAIGVPGQEVVVQLNGGGHFLAPVTYPMKDNKAISGITVNDFNGDGLPDVLVATSSDFEFFPGLSDPNGNPNGMLKTPSLTVTAPHRNYIFLASMDVNHDGKPDLIAIDTFRVALKLGNGDGTFQGAITVYDSSAGDVFGMELAAIGNFDGDSNGDIAVYEEQLQADGETTIPRLTTLYGNGQGAFTPVHTLLNTRLLSSQTLTAADVEFDGRSDVIAWGGGGLDTPPDTPTLEIFHGKGSRTVVEEKIPITLATEHLGPAPLLADFDGDGHNDLAYLAVTPDFSRFDFTYLLGQATGFAAPQSIPLTPQGNNPQHPPAVGDLNGDNRPDWVQYTTDLSGSNALDLLLNTNFAGKHIPLCGIQGRGSNRVVICSPLDGGVSVQNTRFSINSHAFIPITRLEIWVDGKKVHQTEQAWSEINLPLTPGPHRAVAVAVTIDGDTLRSVVNFTVQ
jgi:hypothetical protein